MIPCGFWSERPGPQVLRLLIAHRDQSTTKVRGWFPGFEAVLTDYSDTFPGSSPSGLSSVIAPLPLRGQRRLSLTGTGFPIIPPAFTGEHLEHADVTTALRSPATRKRHAPRIKATVIFLYAGREARVGTKRPAPPAWKRVQPAGSRFFLNSTLSMIQPFSRRASALACSISSITSASLPDTSISSSMPT